MGRSQQTKGKTGEREVVKIIESFGFMARRGQVWVGEPDIICPELPIHFEVKRHEDLAVNQWFAQAEKYVSRLTIKRYPVVVYRQSRHPWQITMKVKDFLRLMDSKGPESDARLTMDFTEFMTILKEMTQ
jgi:Holliday junction resolvase